LLFGIVTELGLDELDAQSLVAGQVRAAKEAMKIEHLQNLVVLIKEVRSLGIAVKSRILVVGDGKNAFALDFADGARRKAHGPVKPDDLGLLSADGLEQFNIDRNNERPHGKAVGDGIEFAGAQGMIVHVKGNEILSEALQGAVTIQAGLSAAQSADVE
jgi:hypothetical protein